MTSRTIAVALAAAAIGAGGTYAATASSDNPELDRARAQVSELRSDLRMTQASERDALDRELELRTKLDEADGVLENASDALAECEELAEEVGLR